MAKNTALSNKLQGFDDQRENKPSELPVQVVNPIHVVTKLKEEQQLNVWIPKDLMKRLKVKGVETDQSLKEMVIEALEQFL